MAFICRECGNLNWSVLDGEILIYTIKFDSELNCVMEDLLISRPLDEEDDIISCPSCESKDMLFYNEEVLKEEDFETLKRLSGAKLRITFLKEKKALEGEEDA